MTHLEMLERGLRVVEVEPGGKDSRYAQDLKGQIAAGKNLQEQTPANVNSDDQAQSSPNNPLEQSYL
jgi:hypothetical protein